MLNKLKGKKFAIAGVGAAVAAVATAQSAMAAPVDMTGVTLPFTVGDMLTTATSFLAIYGPWILLGLAVIFSPVLYKMAVSIVGSIRARFAK